MGRYLHWKQAVMKKIILLVLIFFSICAGCFAQEAETDAGVVLEEAVSTGSTTTEETEIGATEDAIGVPEPVEGADEQAIEENSEDGPSTSSGTTEWG